MKKISFAAAAVISVFGVFPASAGESLVLGNAGLSLPSIEIPSPEVPEAIASAVSKASGPQTAKNNQWQTLRKIKVNTAQPDMNDTLVGLVEPGQDAYAVTRELYLAGFKVRPYQGQDGFRVVADVAGQDAADRAVGLARYYYITEVRVGRKVYEQLFGSGTKSAYAVKTGTIKGGMNHSPVDVKINKLDWTITGGMNHSPVDIRINHEEKTIKGGANHSPVDLKFAWSTEEVTVEGGANHSPVKYTVNWKNGLLEGYSNRAPLKLEFNMGEGYADQTLVTVKGYANRAPVELVYNKVNGHMGGYMNRSPVDVNLVNCDLYDVLQYFFLFTREIVVTIQ
ncbi:MAG: hypothetical protein HY550_07345 [Elusimicrobia bacterium]|nr:hypothetical protein [Elusimicrobiota bacterium]